MWTAIITMPATFQAFRKELGIRQPGLLPGYPASAFGTVVEQLGKAGCTTELGSSSKNLLAATLRRRRLSTQILLIDL